MKQFYTKLIPGGLPEREAAVFCTRLAHLRKSIRIGAGMLAGSTFFKAGTFTHAGPGVIDSATGSVCGSSNDR